MSIKEYYGKATRQPQKFLHLSNTWEKWERNGAVHQLLLPGFNDADDVDLLSENVHTTNKNAEAILLVTSKDGLK